MRYKFSIELNRMTLVHLYFQCLSKNNKGFIVDKNIFIVCSFWSDYGNHAPTPLYFFSVMLQIWSVAHFQINHFNSEGNLFLFSSSSNSLQKIDLVYDCHSVQPSSSFKFLVKTSALADAHSGCLVSQLPSHIAHDDDWTMHWNPCFEEHKLVVPQSTQLVRITSGYRVRFKYGWARMQ